MHVLNAELLPPPVKEVSARELLPCMKNRGLMHWVESSTRETGGAEGGRIRPIQKPTPIGQRVLMTQVGDG